MAFEATHIRFALDLAARLKIQDISAYLSGSIYPDSRYATGISRNITHGGKAPQDPFVKGLDDFHKGWATHLLYDELGIEKYKNLSPTPNIKIEGFGDLWVFTTAEKLIEDMECFKALGKQRGLIQDIQPPEVLNNENKEHLNKYYADIKQLYTKSPTLSGYYNLMTKWHIPDQVANAVYDLTESFQKNPSMIEQINDIYQEIVSAELRGSPPPPLR